MSAKLDSVSPGSGPTTPEFAVTSSEMYQAPRSLFWKEPLVRSGHTTDVGVGLAVVLVDVDVVDVTTVDETDEDDETWLVKVVWVRLELEGLGMMSLVEVKVVVASELIIVVVNVVC